MSGLTIRCSTARSGSAIRRNINLAARINISEWRSNPKSRQYISYIKGAKGRKATDYFRDFIGCQEGVDGPGETRTLLKAFSDFVESEDLPEEAARELTPRLAASCQFSLDALIMTIKKMR